MTQEETRKGMRPRGDGSGRGRGAGQKRKRGDEEEQDGETERDFQDWLVSRTMRTESALLQLVKMVGGLVEEVGELKKKEKTQSKVMKRMELLLTEFRSETADGMRGLKAGLDELAEEESEDGGDTKNGQDREKGNDKIERDGGTDKEDEEDEETEETKKDEEEGREDGEESEENDDQEDVEMVVE